MAKETQARGRFTNQQHSFSVSPSVSRPRSTFSRPSRTTSTIDAGFIYPMYVDEVLPGDTWNMKMNHFGRLATPIRPFMDNLYLDTFWFFVPNRLVWVNWQKFQGEQDDPGDSIDFTIPQMTVAGGSTAGAFKLADFFGLPTLAVNLEVSALPFRGHNLIYNEFFRDQVLQDSVVVDTGDADSTETDYILMRRGKRKDYLTGCLPAPQRGAAVELPLGTSAPVVAVAGPVAPTFDVGGSTGLNLTGSSAVDNPEWSTNPAQAGPNDVFWGSATGLEADLTGATATTLNAFRNAVAIQHILELDARTGTRYVEALKGRWGVTSPDFRLQRPEYLGGGSSNISVTAVPSTTDSANAELGDLGATGIGMGQSGFTHSFTEHGYLFCYVSIRADYMYYTGVDRHWSRLTRYDFYEPELAHLGEQPVYNREIWADASANDALVFGYQERFGEYKFGRSMCTGLMRPNHPTTLDVWNLAQEFTTLPTLGTVFITEQPPVDRVIQVVSEPHFLIDCFFKNACTRIMPVFNTPGLGRL